MVIAVVKGNLEMLFTWRKNPADARVSMAAGVLMLSAPDTDMALPTTPTLRLDVFICGALRLWGRQGRSAE